MQQANYNEISKIYDDVRQGDVVLINHFLQELRSDEPLNILDIGCGTGNYTDLFQKVTQARKYRVYGIDPSEGMIGKARAKNPQIIFQPGAVEAIPSKNDFFDFIYMTDVIHHVPDIQKMFSEIHRVLKPGGKVCIVTQSHRQIGARPVAQFFPGMVRIDRERYPDIDEILTAARTGRLAYLRQEVLFEGDVVELGEGFLALIRKKGYSMLHLLTEEEYQKGVSTLEIALQNGPIQVRAAGETLVWFTKE